MSAEQRLNQLVDRLVDYKANVFLTPAADVAARLAELLPAAGRARSASRLDGATWLGYR